MINNQRGEIATVVALVGLSVVTAGVFIANQLVKTGPRDTPLAAEPTPIVCGGLRGRICPTEYVCVYANGSTRAPYPDAQGDCKSPAGKSPTPQVCTTDAKICPDGTKVGRTGPNCTFVCPPFKTPTRSPSKEPSVCGGISGIVCSGGRVCIYENGSTRAPYPDAQGFCLLPTNPPTGGPTKKPTTVPQSTRKIYSLEDTYVDKKNPGQNYCRKQLRVDGDPVNISYLKFDFRKIKNNILSAKLFLRVTDSSNSIQRVRAVSSNNWSECTLTYNKRPSVQTPIASFNGSSTGKWVAVDISSYIKNKSGQIVSLAIDSSGSNGIAFFSRENSTYKPFIEIKTGGSGITPTKKPTSVPSTGPTNPDISITPTEPPSGGTITPTNTPADVEINFSPANVNIPPATKVSIMVNAGNKEAAFTRVVFNFDPSKIKLTSEITTNPNISTVVEKTLLSEANTSGKVIIVLALSPTDTVPTGSFELASFNIDANTSALEAADTFIFDRNDSQVVDKNGPQLSVNYSDGTASINGPSASCVKGDMGNLNCSIDGCIDTADFELFNQDYGKTTAELNIATGNHTPDLITDTNNMIDTADFEIFRANFGSCQ